MWAQRQRPVRTHVRFMNVGGGVLAAGMSYQALFAVFAALWVGFSVLGITLRDRPELLSSLVEQINLFVPGLVGTGSGGSDGSDGAVELDTLLQARVLDWTSIAAGVALIWVALAWFTGTRRAIRIIFSLEVRRYRNPVLLKLRDFALAMTFFLAILTSAVLTVLSSSITESIMVWAGMDPDGWLMGGLGTTARYGVLYAFDVLVLIAIHRYLAEVKVPRLSLLQGCALGGAGMFVLKLLGTALLGGASSNPLLASFAVLIGLLLWFNLICRTLLLTACWVATGQDTLLGLPKDLR